jgi:hypothetical protein
VTLVADLEELRRLLAADGIHTVQAAMRSKDLAKLGDSLVNLLYSLAQSMAANRFEGTKVSGKTLASALRNANLRHLAPSRLDAHGLGDSVEALIAYAWIRGTFTIPEAATLLARELQRAAAKPIDAKPLREQPAVSAFAALLQHIFANDQGSQTQSQ